MKVKVTVLLSGGKKELFAEVGERVMDVLDAADVSVYAPCGGAGICGGCRAKITGNIIISEDERGFISDKERASGVHLLCKTRISGDAAVDLRGREIEAETDGRQGGYVISPLAKGKYGVAADIGTTTVALYLCSLETGEVLGTVAFENPQRSFGADVISRIDAIMRDYAALERQRKLIIAAINGGIAKLCRDFGISCGEISAAAICGNTVMEHILVGLDPTGIATAPFTPKSLFGGVFPASKLGITAAEDAPVLIAPCVASYVGGDISCGFSVQSFGEEDVLYVDIGTNGELVMLHEGKLYACSTAAGPALEGARLSRGMAGEAGAVCEVSMSDNILMYKTVKDEQAKGICGSGAIDALALMIEKNVIDETGKMNDCPLVKSVGNERAFVIDDEREIYVTASDVRELQLAKAAICAGALTLADACGASAENMKIVIAGGFGAHLRASAMLGIGLLPRTDERNISFVGNAAGMGAVGLLCSEEIRKRAAEFCRSTEYIELSESKKFMDFYIEQMTFE